MILNLFANYKNSKLALPQHQTILSGGRHLEIHGNINACAKLFN